jgi:putative DNA primase/helicase
MNAHPYPEDFLDQQPYPEARSGKRKRRFEKSSSDTRRVIELDKKDLHKSVKEAGDALRSLGSLYYRGDSIVSLVDVPKPGIDGATVIGTVIRERKEHALQCDLASAAIFTQYDARADAQAAVGPPMQVVKALVEKAGEIGLPVLMGVTHAPMLREDGSIVTAPGYDRASGMVYNPLGVEFPPIPKNPTYRDALKARDEILDLIQHFPFVAGPDKAVALSMILSAVARPALDAVPMHGVSATAAGTGKGKLVNIASVIATGRSAPVIAEGGDGAEFEKRLAAELFDGAPIIAIDNAEKPIGGQLLNQILTEPTVKPRILGRSENIPIPNKSLVMATGNNLQIFGDMGRRTLICSLDAKMERPELREFEFEPVSVAGERRPRLLVAALTILRAFRLHGTSSKKKPLGSFEQWSARVRDAICWIGMDDPVDTMEQARDSDPNRAAKRAVFEAWWDILAGERTTVASIADRAPGTPLFDAIIAVAGARGQIDRAEFGRWLRSARRTIIEGKTLVTVGERGGVGVWQMQEVK